ncbi:hypothetical protein SAMN05444365_11468 [Micromonospora pattaloongensis]|uniref:Uncharacterized protein n=1 Tax=Micromonospora pattaloongensis TaxID=405436 RepID=A0A1H3SXD9_9ACTN|nr:hypothetical protein [Micromonospora pattaloongensis]SDZ41769.1 hypothetical protein SAMN05444365_11468 [Micromonospora pattaloongensis]
MVDESRQRNCSTPRVSYSPLRTVLEHGVESAERVSEFLREQSRG